MARKPTAKRCGVAKMEGSRALRRLVSAGEAGAAGDLPGARALISEGLAIERGGRLYATAPGRARAAREAEPHSPYLAQHRELGRSRLRTEEGGFEDLLVDLDESPLAWLARRKGKDGKPMLSAVEVAAGEKLRADFTRGQMNPRVTANWEATVASGRRAGSAAEVADAAMAARARVSKAIEAVGPELSGALIDICCFLKGMEEVARDRGWPARGAKLVLGLGLRRLAGHYGLMASGTGGGRILAWGAPDSRPTIDGGKTPGETDAEKNCDRPATS